MIRPSGSRRFFRRVGMMCLSTALLLVLGEAFVRAFVPVRNVGPSFTTFDETYGVALKKDFRCERITPEFTMHFSTNAQGHRGESADEGAILFLGDSFTMGYGVDDGQEFPALVKRELGETIDVVNAGIGGTGNGRWITYLEREASRLRPRAVVLQVCGNDFEDNLGEAWFQLDAMGELQRGENEPRRSLKRRAQAIVESIPGLSYSRLLGMLRGLRVRGSAPGVVRAAERNPASDALTWAILERAIDRCAELDVPVVLVSAAVEESRMQKLRAIASRRAARLVETPSKESRPDLYYRVDGHWNAEGHRLCAKEVCAALAASEAL